ncbi:MAG TPA: HD domain-containing phosphohydrolase [Longimicrobiales bacterium]
MSESTSLRSSATVFATPLVRIRHLVDQAHSAEQAGEWTQALERYAKAFSLVTSEGDAAMAAEILRCTGVVHWQRGDGELAEECFDGSIEIALRADLPLLRARALNCLAIVEQFRGRIDRARELYGEARAIAGELQDDRTLAMVDQNLGTLANIQGEAAEALSSYKQALRGFLRLNDTRGQVWALINMGIAHTDLGAWDDAERSFNEAFTVADAQRDTANLGTIEANRAKLYVRKGDHVAARESCDRAFEIFARLGSRRWLAETHRIYGLLFRETGKRRLALMHLKEAASAAAASEDRLCEAEAEAEAALLHLQEERNADALRSLNRAHRLFTELHARRELLDIDARLDGLESRYLEVVRAWGEAIESTDRYTAGHCERVADYTCLLGGAVGIHGRDLTWLRMGAFLHDVGKTEVPVDVLNKPTGLTSAEWELMKAHTTRGDEIVAALDFPWEIRPIVRSHHEKWDGTGYPDQLAGTDIPLHARILCIADVFDALTTTRSYRPALSRAEALRIMRQDAGRHFDPELLDIFCSVLPPESRSELPPVPPRIGGRPEMVAA